MLDPDIGYSTSSLIWRYTSPYTRRPVEAKFEAQHRLIGDRAIVLVNAAKRISGNGAMATIANAVLAIRKCASAIAERAPQASDAETWFDAAVEALSADTTIAERSRWNLANQIGGILREVARYREESFLRRNPFDRTSMSTETILRGTELAPLMEHAKRDVLSIVSAIRQPKPAHIPFIERARALSVDGLFMPGDVNGTKTPAILLEREWRRETGLNLSDLTLHLYPSPRHLVPFLILITYALAGNAESVALIRRNAAVPLHHPAYGPCFELTLEKPRAGEIAPYLVRDGGTLSVGWLIRAVLEMTEPLVRYANEINKNLAFLAVTNHGNVASMSGNLKARSMRSYVHEHHLPTATLRSLRRARGLDEYEKTSDPFRVQRLLNQADFSQTASYLRDVEIELRDETAIADVQRLIAKGKAKNTEQEHNELGPAVMVSHTCMNPREKSLPLDQDGICQSLLWPFNDAHFILSLEPRSVAYLLRDYSALCEAQKSLPADRFKIYLPKKRKIEDDYLPLIDDALRAAAEALIDSIPRFPRIEAL